MQALETQNGETIVANGAAEANALGLTTQVPTREVFITSGPSRTLMLGNRAVELKHGHRWQLALGKRPAGKAVRALSWLGPARVHKTLRVLKAKLPAAEWEVMRATRAALPGWMAQAVGEVSTRG